LIFRLGDDIKAGEIWRVFMSVERFGGGDQKTACGWRPLLLGAILAGGMTFALHGFFFGLKGYILPRVHDEFSYLLTSDTFAQGRLANPPSKFADHFETFHVLQSPTYASKYPPLHGFFLFLGRFLGDPSWGMALEASLAVALIYGALFCWGGWKAAAVGAFLGWTQVAPFMSLSSSLMGGLVTVVGGALVLWTGLRVTKREGCDPWDGVTAAAGAILLLLSRPFEGLLLCLPLLLLMVIVWWKQRLGWLDTTRTLIPGLIVLLAGVALQAVYNHAVTGNALRLPYSVYEEKSSNIPLFIFQEPTDRALTYHPLREALESDHVRAEFERVRGQSFFERLMERSGAWLVDRPLWPLFAGLMVAALFGSWGRVDVWVWGTLCFVMAGSSWTTWFAPYYVAALIPLVVYLWLKGWLVVLAMAEKIGRGSLLPCRAIQAIGLAVALAFMVAGFSVPTFQDKAGEFARARAEVEGTLKEAGGTHLVFVRYLPGHDVHADWVVNGADRIGAPILWAHDLGEARNKVLIEARPGRRVWSLQSGGAFYQLSPLLPAPDDL
jgi:hypothetical protein